MSDGESSDGEVDFRPTLDIESLPKVPVLDFFFKVSTAFF